VDPPPSRVLLRSTAVRQGLSDGEIARALRRRELHPLQRGAYLEQVVTDETLRYRAVIAATVAGLRRPSVVSHVSAAVLHGLPLWRLPLGRVHVIRQPPAAGSGSSRVHLHIALLPDDQVDTIDGLVVTGLTRTVVDVARSVPFESAVIVADAALGRPYCTPELLRSCLDQMGPVPGCRRAARALAFADGRSESVGESRSRVLLDRVGLPAPQLQRRLLRTDGTLIGRSDFSWDELGTVGEFDGKVKYGALLRPGQTPADAVYAEKLREDEIRDMGWQVARWTWSELDRPQVVADRLRRAFARGRRPG
jgi:hypothetical protein